MHLFPQLRKVEEKYANELVVIGVHSAKFDTEKLTANIRQAVLRHEVEHPVLNDAGFKVWRMYGVNAWPTLILIDPIGKIIGVHRGEIRAENLDNALAGLVKEYDRLLDRQPLKLERERDRELERQLAFPSKVLADEFSNQLFIADTNHNRIIIADLDGNVFNVIGSGQMGLEDGDFKEAQFNHPHGMALDSSNNLLYVADTENHTIRRVDLIKETVNTIAGTGEQARWYPEPTKRISIRGTEKGISSPWDLTLIGKNLYICMAGFHQIWVMDLDQKELRPYAGNGREGLKDGSLSTANLAQSSGITTNGRVLYFADSEVSSIRTADLNPNGQVRTIVGKDLFVFGDTDGIGDDVRLQHPIGIVFHDGRLYIADTYNHKIKIIHPDTKRCDTFLGSGEPGDRDGSNPLFFEPSGVSIAHDRLYIADSNNHVIRVANLKTKDVTTLKLKGLD